MFSALFNDVANVAAKNSDYLDDSVTLLANIIKEKIDDSKIVTIFGNGGSAADAQHWAAELVCTYGRKGRVALPALALTTDTSALTACANDFSFDYIFERQIEALSAINGISIGLSTSGKSLNVLNALQAAKQLGAIPVIGDLDESYSYVDLHIKFISTNANGETLLRCCIMLLDRLILSAVKMKFPLMRNNILREDLDEVIDLSSPMPN